MITIVIVLGFIKTALLLIAVLAVLVLVHEAGHFVIAKMVGMRVDEFGFGYPPRVWAKKIGSTEYSINALPFGGFVRIYGEDAVQEGVEEGGNPTTPSGTSVPEGVVEPALSSSSSAFVGKSRLAQAAVLLAGVTMNFILAWILVISALAIGVPRLIAPNEIVPAHSFTLAVDTILPNSPASLSGLKRNDIIVGVSAKDASWEGQSLAKFTSFISSHAGKQISLSVLRGGKTRLLTAVPANHVSSKYPNKVVLGFSFATLGTVPLSIGQSISEGTALTWTLISVTAVGLGNFFWHIFTLSVNLSQVAGPVGIAGAVGTAASHGIGNLFFLMAIISVNLAIINLLPIPALDGGRLLFVLIEALIRRPIPARITNTINTISFSLLILLMVVITIHDVFRMVS